MEVSFKIKGATGLAIMILTQLAWTSHNTTPVDSRYLRPAAWSPSDLAEYIRGVVGLSARREPRPEWVEFNEEVKRIYAALSEWEAGEPASYSWSQDHDSYPVDDGVTVSGEVVRVWVANSGIHIRRLGDGEYLVHAGGARASFALNTTGAVGAELLSGRVGEVSDLVVESQGEEVDRLPENLFRRSFKARREDLLKELLALYAGSDELSAATQAFREALDAAEPYRVHVCRVRRHMHDQNDPQRRLATGEDDVFVEVV